jgi:hypothetical protein
LTPAPLLILKIILLISETGSRDRIDVVMSEPMIYTTETDMNMTTTNTIDTNMTDTNTTLVAGTTMADTTETTNQTVTCGVVVV